MLELISTISTLVLLYWAYIAGRVVFRRIFNFLTKKSVCLSDHELENFVDMEICFNEFNDSLCDLDETFYIVAKNTVCGESEGGSVILFEHLFYDNRYRNLTICRLMRAKIICLGKFGAFEGVFFDNKTLILYLNKLKYFSEL